MTAFRHLKVPLRILAVFILLAVLFYLLITLTSLPEHLAAKLFERLLGRSYGLTISVGNIGGSLLSGVTLNDLYLHNLQGDTT